MTSADALVGGRISSALGAIRTRAHGSGACVAFPADHLTAPRTSRAYRPGQRRDVASRTKRTLRMLARRALALEAEVAELDAILEPLVAETAPALVARPGLGTDYASALLVAAGDNPARLRTEATFAHLCRVAPLDASSGKQQRHRLNRGGDRQANSALWHIVITRMVNDPRTRHYIERRMNEGLTKKEAFRCLIGGVCLRGSSFEGLCLSVNAGR